jgi:tetratricopeptide (TPR) repeat protein
MADKTEIEYTPEELEEIERIVSRLPGSDSYAESDSAYAEGVSHEDDNEFLEIEEEPSEDSGELVTEPEPQEEEVEDITGMIQELPESSEEEPAFSSEDEELQEIEPADLTPVDEIEELPSEALTPEIPEDEFLFEAPAAPAPAPEPGPEIPSAGGRTVREELDRLTESEPPAVDAQEVPDDIYHESDFPEKETADMDFPPFEEAEPDKAEEEKLPEVSIEGGMGEDIPDLSGLSIGESGEIPEASASDIPDIGVDSLGSFAEPMSLDEESGDKSAPDVKPSSLEDMDSFETAAAAEEAKIPGMLADELPDIPSMGLIEEAVASEPVPEVEPEIEVPDLPPARDAAEPSHFESFNTSPETSSAKGGADFTEAELRRLKNAILLFPAPLIRAIKDVILNDKMNEADTRLLVDMILTGRDENDIRRFIEDRLRIKINVDEDVSKRKVISARSEYSSNAARQRQKILFRRTRIAAAGVGIFFIASLLGYQFIYKPWKAKSLISDGVALILKKAEIGDERKNFEKAEALFKRVDDDYVKDYLPGYNSYGRAYFDKKQYERSLRKLNQAYYIKPSEISTLNNLGFFYKKVPDAFYDEELKPKLKDMYYKNSAPAVARIQSKYDVAIDFYLKAQHIAPKNVAALVGMGDVYLLKGEYLKARQYYESILKVDDNSIAGYSGLMNLFIERDDFPDLLSVFVELRQKDLLDKVSSPLLGKLAGYLLSKKAVGDHNIRVEYGIQSDRIKDSADNPYPAVKTVLAAMHRHDADYPPLYLHYAKFALAQKNFVMVKGYLEQAIDRAEDRGQKYYGALSMLGEYYYNVKDPVKSYRFLKESLAALNYPADFTREDFYHETEKPGRTQAVMGNIYYYFFDKVSARFGDEKEEATLEEEAPSADADRLVNYDIALKKYEAAVKDGYSSSELNYNLGRIYYLKGLYDNALNQWLKNYEDFVSSPEIMYALGNAFYHMNNTESAKAEFQKLISVNEHEAERISTVVPSREDHVKLFDSLSAAYNNLGAVYLRKGSETRSNICFWKAIEYAHKLGHENEFARVNLARTIRKKGDPRQPVLDENIPFSVNIYRAEMRDRHEFR